MAKKQKQPTKACADCIHESACRIWTDGRLISDASADVCPNHETVKESGAYLCGVLDERNRKKTHGDQIRTMSDEELAQMLNQAIVCHTLREHGYCHKCSLFGANPCDTEGLLEWLKQPAEGE